MRRPAFWAVPALLMMAWIRFGECALYGVTGVVAGDQVGRLAHVE